MTLKEARELRDEIRNEFHLPSSEVFVPLGYPPNRYYVQIRYLPNSVLSFREFHNRSEFEVWRAEWEFWQAKVKK